jgi:hypothetical protein
MRVEARGGGEGIESERAVTGLAGDGTRPLDERIVLAAGSPSQLERRQVVVSEHLGVVLGTTQ